MNFIFGLAFDIGVKDRYEDTVCYGVVGTEAGQVGYGFIADAASSLPESVKWAQFLRTQFQQFVCKFQMELNEVECVDAEELEMSDAEEALRAFFLDQNATIYNECSDRVAIAVTCALFLKNHVVIAHCGDTAATLYRTVGKKISVCQLTTPHTLCEKMKRQGIKPQLAKAYSNVLTNCMGNKPNLFVETKTTDVSDGARFLFASDGVMHRSVAERTHLMSLENHHPQDAATKLIQICVAENERDNMTALIVDIHH